MVMLINVVTRCTKNVWEMFHSNPANVEQYPIHRVFHSLSYLHYPVSFSEDCLHMHCGHDMSSKKEARRVLRSDQVESDVNLKCSTFQRVT